MSDPAAFNGSAKYATAAAFRRALDSHLRTAAKDRGRPLDKVRREFLFQRFLGLVFAGAEDGWILKGGASLLMRLAGARYSKDLDLLRLEKTGDAVHDLRTLTAARPGDQLRFVIGDKVSYSQRNQVVQITVVASIGAEYDRFTIDIALELHFLAEPERIRPVPVVDIEGLPALPEIVVYPMSDQVADKVCAMYELHGTDQSPSSRFRDLVDLALITAGTELDAEPIAAALRSEGERRQMDLPGRLVSPGPAWSTSYTAEATAASLDPALRSLDEALARVGEFINPLLDGTRTSGRWRPGVGWHD